MTSTTKKTKFVREIWLNQAVDKLKPIFNEQGHTIGKIYISVGWPGGRGNHNKTIGQTWECATSDDKSNHIFLSPVVSDTTQALAVITHELCHVVDDCQHAHNKPFISIAKSVGLVGPWTATAASDELKGKFNKIVDEIGKFKTSKLNVTNADNTKTQSTRMLKINCPDCGYLVRTTQKWVNVGLPICSKCDVEMELA